MDCLLGDNPQSLESSCSHLEALIPESCIARDRIQMVYQRKDDQLMAKVRRWTREDSDLRM